MDSWLCWNDIGAYIWLLLGGHNNRVINSFAFRMNLAPLERM